MSKSEITLDNFTDWHGKVRGVEIRSFMPLPEYVPTTEININLGRVATLARIGRLESVRFSLYDEDQDVSYGISGVNAGGSATASAVKVETANRTSNSVNRPSDDAFKYIRGRGQIKINASHPDMDNQVLRDTQPWVRLLDRSMREGLRDSGKKQLTEPKLERVAGFGVSKVFDGIIGGGYAAVFQAPEFIPIYMVWSALDDGLGMTRRLGAKIRKKPIEDYEHSLLYHWPQDRVFALNAISRTRKIVTAK